MASWVLGFGLVLFAGVSGGAFEISVFAQVGTYSWLLLALGILLGLFPLDRPGADGWSAVGLWLGLLAWGVLGLLWTDSPDKTWLEVARLATYAGVFCLALAARGRGDLSHQIGSVAAGVCAVAILGLLSRFQPDLFPSATDTGRTLTSEAARLSFPLDYWNGVAALVAIGVAPVLAVAGGASRIHFRALATAMIPVLMLTLYFTISRGGILSALLATVVYFCLADRRLERALPVLIGFVGGVCLILFTKSQDALKSGLVSDQASSQGDTTMVVTIAVCLLVGLGTWLLLSRMGEIKLPERFKPTGKQVGAGLLAIGIVIIVGFLAAGGPERVSSGWESFKSSDPPAEGGSRLEAANGNGRYQYWASSVEQWKTAPLVGEGPGTYEYWWAENGDRAGFIRDAHSLFFQSLGESGLVGTILLLGLFGLILVVGIRASLVRVPGERNPRVGWVAAAAAGSVAFFVAVAVDWSWQLPAVVIPFLLLAATIMSQTSTPGSSYGYGRRAALVVVPLVAVGLIAIPLSSNLALKSSQEKARDGDLEGALDAARAAHSISPGTAAPMIQEAGLLEELGASDLAVAKAREATESEPVNWRNWLVLSTIELRAGQADQALEDFREAKRLNPRSPIFDNSGSD